MHKTNDSEVKYLESENEYSFHSCPNRSCLPGMFAWLKAKYPIYIFLSVGARVLFCCSYPRRKDGWSQLRHQYISKPLFNSARGFYALVHVLRTNHSMVALSHEGRLGLWLRTRARVMARMTSHPPANIPNRVDADH